MSTILGIENRQTRTCMITLFLSQLVFARAPSYLTSVLERKKILQSFYLLSSHSHCFRRTCLYSCYEKIMWCFTNKEIRIIAMFQQSIPFLGSKMFDLNSFQITYRDRRSCLKLSIWFILARAEELCSTEKNAGQRSYIPYWSS